jgi:RimJ/RimL family protein N-acetyltransferase
MHFSRFGITLRRLDPDDLEMVRQWRNSSWVRPYMHYREWIGPDEQMLWFQGLDSKRDWYFTARAGDTPFGLFDIKAIDWSDTSGESGGFVGDPSFIGRPEPAQAVLALMDFAFLVLRLQSLRARYRANLQRVVQFNRQLGYVVMREADDGFLYSQVTAASYLQCAASLRKAALAVHGTAAALVSSPPWLINHMQPLPEKDLPDFQLDLR